MQKLFGLLDNEALSAIASMVISPMSFSILVSIVRHVTYEEIFAWERVERIREQGVGYSCLYRTIPVWQFDLNRFPLHAPYSIQPQSTKNSAIDIHLQGYDPVPTGGTAAASQNGSLSAGNADTMRDFKSPSGNSATTSLA